MKKYSISTDQTSMMRYIKSLEKDLSLNHSMIALGSYDDGKYYCRDVAS